MKGFFILILCLAIFTAFFSSGCKSQLYTSHPAAANTPTSTATSASTQTMTMTPSFSMTATATGTPTSTETSTFSPTKTWTSSPTATGTDTLSPTLTQTFTTTMTPTATSTPTSTASPTVTSSPTTIPTPVMDIYCDSDDTASMPVSGYFSIGNTESIVPLCNGWILYGNRVTNQIIGVNVVTGTAAVTYQLNAAPGEMAFDETVGLLYSTLDNATKVAKVDLNSGVVSYITLTQSALHLAVASSGKFFAQLNPGASSPATTLAYVDGVNNSMISAYTSSTYGNTDAYIQYDPVDNYLFSGVRGISPSALTRYIFNSATYALTSPYSRSDVGSNGEELSISRDFDHLAFCVGSGNGGYVIDDFPPSDISTSNGSWNIGAYPGSADFSPDSQLVVAENGNDVMVFSTVSHAVSKQWLGVSAGVYYGLSRARFSRGGGLVFALDTDGFSTQPSGVFWAKYP